MTTKLPPWFTRPQPLDETQIALFRVDSAFALARLQISEDDVRRWHEQKWLSFESLDEAIDEAHDPRVNELILVRDLTRSGLSDAQIDEFLRSLPRPLRFDCDKIAFSFRHGWVEPAEPNVDEIIEKHLRGWLARLVEEGNANQLEEIKEMVGWFVKNARSAEKTA